ncbi:MAG: hypothetical protein MI922_14100, partial [Bacteroidales bacterium]|nr:hypothetical protein [Bacteroidales bacterium]
MVKFSCFIVVVFMLLNVKVTIAGSKSDSILALIQSASSDSLKVIEYIELAYAEKENNIELAKLYADSAVYFGQKAGNNDLYLSSLEEAAYFNYKISNYNKSQDLYNTFLAIADTSYYSYTLIRVYNGFGIISRTTNNYSYAIELHQRALDVSSHL